MRFSFSATLFAIACAVGLSLADPILDARQEAARFGIVNVVPTTVKLGEVSFELSF